jgi:hypothetical protein
VIRKFGISDWYISTTLDGIALFIDLIIDTYLYRGEFVRFIFALSGIEFTDDRIKWPEYCVRRFATFSA